MRIATWNVNGLRARLDYLTRWLGARRPGLVGLRDLDTPGDLFPHDHFADLGYQALVHGQKSWNGVAVLSKVPTTLTHTGVPNQEQFGSRQITVNVDDKLAFTTVYCPNGKNLEHADFAGKLAWYDDLTTQWQTTTSGPEHRIICGDFNIVPEAIDGWRGEAGEGSIFYTKEERREGAACRSRCSPDQYHHQFPDAQEFSWWDYRGGAFHRKHGLRIDFILGTAGLLDLTENVVIDREYRRKIDELTASDHAPVYADIKL